MTLALAFRTAAADGKITDLEVRSVIRQAARSTLTGAETKVLGQQLQRYSDQFEGDAKTRLSRFVAAAGKPARTSDPRVMTKDLSSTRYRPVTGSLSRDGFTARDVVQGATGDCYLLATLSSAARSRPGLISDAITQKADGSWLVRFYGPQAADGKAAPVYIPVDRDLAGDRRGTRYARSSTRGELWVSLVEKAYAKWQGGFEKIGNGGAPSDVMQALTGRTATWAPTSEGDVFEKMRSQLGRKGLVVVSTRTGPQYRGSGVVPSHAYSVLSVADQNGVKTVTVRNPWGKTEPGQPRAGDGVFQLPLARFLALFPDLFLGA